MFLTNSNIKKQSDTVYFTLPELTLEALGNGKIKILIPRQAGEKAFIFESSTDAITWAEVLFSSATTVTLSNQTPVTTLYIRYSAISKTGKGPSSQAKSVVVL